MTVSQLGQDSNSRLRLIGLFLPISTRAKKNNNRGVEGRSFSCGSIKETERQHSKWNHCAKSPGGKKGLKKTGEKRSFRHQPHNLAFRRRWWWFLAFQRNVRNVQPDQKVHYNHRKQTIRGLGDVSLVEREKRQKSMTSQTLLLLLPLFFSSVSFRLARSTPHGMDGYSITVTGSNNNRARRWQKVFTANHNFAPG